MPLPEVNSLQVNVEQLETRLRLIEDRFDTLNTPVWRRVVFRLDGWPAWHHVVAEPRRRPWRRWWRS